MEVRLVLFKFEDMNKKYEKNTHPLQNANQTAFRGDSSCLFFENSEGSDNQNVLKRQLMIASFQRTPSINS